MTRNLPAAVPEAPLVIDEGGELHPDHRDPQQPRTRQNLRVALLPLALIVLLVLAFIATAWTFLAAARPA